MVLDPAWLEDLEKNVKNYFKDYDFLEIFLTQDIKPCIIFKCNWDEVTLEYPFNISEDYCLIGKGDREISYEEVWRYLFVNTMNHYQNAMIRLMKEVDKKNS